MKKLIFSSFGFKYGIPQDANYVLDVRFIPNPYYVAELKPLSGMDEPVRQFIDSFEGTGAFLTASILFLDFVIPQYLKGDRDFVHVAVGCTGGKHRSVVLAERIYRHYSETSADIGVDFELELRHRDISKTPEA